MDLACLTRVVILFSVFRFSESSAQTCVQAYMIDGSSYNCPELTYAPGLSSTNSPSDFKAAQCPTGWNLVIWQAGIDTNAYLESFYLNKCCKWGVSSVDTTNPRSTQCWIGNPIAIGVEFPPTLSSLFPTVGDPYVFWGFNGYTVYMNLGSVIGITLLRVGSPDDTRDTAGLTTGVSATYFCAPGSMINGFSYILNGYGIQSMSALCKSSLCSSNNNQFPQGCGCPAGTYSSISANACLACPVGTYSPQSFMTACVACTSGGVGGSPTRPADTSMVTYTSNGGTQDACSYNCNAGYGVSPGTDGTCLACIPGYYKSAVDKSGCIQCGPGKYSGASASSACTPCLGNQYQPNYASASCSPCIWVNPAQGNYILDCTPTTPSSSAKCPACAAGNVLNPPCDPSSITVPACAACPTGTHQSVPIGLGYAGAPYVCQTCPTGTYSSSIGAAGCLKCSKQPPANGNWAPWTSPVSDACPFQCNAGYQMDASGSVCSACPLGKYTLVSAGTQTCVACTLSLANGYWLRPVLFNASWNGCPWDCNAGYYADFKTGNCIPCQAGKFARAGTQRVDDTQAANVCLGCSTCVAGYTYESAACTPLTDRECATCTAACNVGYYVRPCNLTADRTCIACKQTCASGQYMSGGCTGGGTQDAILCIACNGPAICNQGTTYMPSGQCPGNGRVNAGCVVCSQVSCPFGTYQVACTTSVDTSCVPYTQCKPGVTTLRGRGLFNDGEAFHA